MIWTDLVLAVVCGAVLPLQAAMNAGMIDDLNSDIGPGVVANVIGAALLSLLFFCGADFGISPMKSIINMETMQLIKTCPKYLYIFPGILGAVYVTFAAVLSEQIGLTLFFVSLIAGQTTSSVAADAIGFQGLKVNPPTSVRFFAIALVFSGSLVSVADKFADSFNNSELATGKLIIYMLLSFMSGLGFGIQPPMNAKMQRHFKTLPHRVTWWSFLIAPVLMQPIAMVIATISDEPINYSGLGDIAWWKYLGGPLGVVTVLGTVYLAPRIGMGLIFVLMVAGQLISSLIIDSFGWLETDQVDVSATRIIGVILVYMAVLVFRMETRIQKIVSEARSSKKDSKTSGIETEPEVEEKLEVC